MTASLSMTCGCGRTTSAPCPSVEDILTVQQQFEGWGFDERGHVQCPPCKAGVKPVPQKPASIDFGPLFDGRAA